MSRQDFCASTGKKTKVDIWGALLLIASLACMETATSRGERDLWFQSNWITLALLAAVIFFIAFLWWDYSPENPSPVLHLRIIVRHAALRTYFLVILIVGAFFGAGLYVVPQYLRFVQDYSALQAGGFISMYTLGLGLGLQYALHLLIPRLGPVRTLAVGLLILVATYPRDLLYLDPHHPHHRLGACNFPARLLHRARYPRCRKCCLRQCADRSGQ